MEKNKPLAWFIAGLGAFPINRDSADRQAIRNATSALKRGESIGIFPEGTRVRKPDQTSEIHGGFALIAQMGKAPVVPVAICGADKVRPYGVKLFRLPKITLNIGEPVYLSRVDELPRSERLPAFSHLTMAEVFKMRDEHSSRP